LFGGMVLLLASGALAAFMLNRVYVGLRYKELNVRGWVYSQEGTPAKYWFTIIMAGLGLAFSVLLLVAAVSGLTGALD